MSFCKVNLPADKYNDATANFDQTVSVNGVKVSTLSTSTTPCLKFEPDTDVLQKVAMALDGVQQWNANKLTAARFPSITISTRPSS